MLLEARAGIEPTYGDLQSHRGYGGPSRNRTDVHGFAVRCIATLPSGRRGPCVYRATKATARPPTGPRSKLDLENEQKVPGTKIPCMAQVRDRFALSARYCHIESMRPGMAYNAIPIVCLGLLMIGVEGYRHFSRSDFNPFVLALGLGIAWFGVRWFQKPPGKEALLTTPEILSPSLAPAPALGVTVFRWILLVVSFFLALLLLGSQIGAYFMLGTPFYPISLLLGLGLLLGGLLQVVQLRRKKSG